MNRRVVITGLGVISSIGIGKDAFWDSLLKGKSGISPVSSIDTTRHFTHYGGEIKNFHPTDFISADKLSTISRASQMALAAAYLSIKDTGLSVNDLNSKKIGTCIGITSGPIQVIEHINDVLIKNEVLKKDLIRQLPVHSAAAVISRELGLSGPNALFSTACAAGNYAVGRGFDLIRLEKADLVLAGASDPFSRISFTGFNQFSAVAPEKCQPFDKNRKGMIPGEGAAVLILEVLEQALDRKAEIYAEVLGYGLSCDASHMTLATKEGIAACMVKAMRETSITTKDVDYISAHGTGTPANDRAECAAIKEVFGERYKSIPISSIKSMLGHTMGAASALEAVTCALAVKHDIIPPTINYETPDPECDIDCVPNHARAHIINILLNNSYAFGGNNASLVLKKYCKEG
jgi:3-oxoacyl-[acyl-carrier-protein] synthase II